MESDIAANISRILEKIREKASLSGRKVADIRLMAVTKTVEDARIRDAVQAGIKLIGENYVQETARKKDLLEQQGTPFEWHMIGRLQTNKVKDTLSLFSVVHSVDSLHLAETLSKRASSSLQVLLETNVSGEAAKAGFAPEALPEALNAIRGLPNLRVEGLMTIAPLVSDLEQARPFFRRLREMRDQLGLAELSMGMTNDFEVAVEEGATLVRIGRAIFGER